MGAKFCVQRKGQFKGWDSAVMVLDQQQDDLVELAGPQQL